MSARTSQTESIRGDLGQGLYSLSELRTFVSYPHDPDAGYWVFTWLTEVLNPVGHAARKPDYSFSDLISLFVVRELRRRGVRAVAIRNAEAWLRRRWGTDRPFVSERIATDGQNVYVDDKLIAQRPEALEAANLAGQHTMLEPIRDQLTAVRYHHGHAFQWAPTEHVLLDPRVQFGDPVVTGTRVPTAEVDKAADRVGVDQAAEMYGVPREAAGAAVRFERRLSALRG